MSSKDGWRGSGHVFRHVAGTDRTAGKGDETPRGTASSVAGLGADEIDPAELEEFMSSDWLDVKADPVFRERLRERLWDMLRERRAAAGSEASGSDRASKRRKPGPDGRD